MLDGDGYVAHLGDEHFLLRRCWRHGQADRCEVAEATPAGVLATRPAFHQSQRPDPKQLERPAAKLAKYLAKHKARRMGRITSNSAADVRVAMRGPMHYHYILENRRLEVAYRDTILAESEVLVATVSFDEEVSVLGAYLDHMHPERFMVGIRHALGADDYDTSWLLFAHEGPPLAVRVSPIPGHLGHVGRVVPTRLAKRRVGKPEPAPPPPPAAPPPGAPSVPPPPQRCESHADCPSFNMCLAPEEMDDCGTRKTADCPDGHFSSRCGHCRRRCTQHSDCPKGRCNTTDGSGWCISQRHCVYAVTPP